MHKYYTTSFWWVIIPRANNNYFIYLYLYYRNSRVTTSVTVPKIFFYAVPSITVLSLEQGYVLYLTEQGRYLNLATYSLQPTEMVSSHPRDIDTLDKNYTQRNSVHHESD